MNEEEKVKLAFNIGYMMQQYEPALIQKLIPANDNKSEAMAYIASGQKQYKKDQALKEQQDIKQKQQQRMKPKM